MENMTKDELREWRQQKIASLSREEMRDMLNQASERAAKQVSDEFIKKCVERHKQEQISLTESAVSSDSPGFRRGL